MSKLQFAKPTKRLAFSLALSLVCVGAAHSAAVLIHSYNFASAVTDSVGSANGTLFNGASIQGHALVTDGVDDFIEFGAKIVPTSGSFSVAFWVNEASRSGTWTEVISQGFSGGPAFYLGHNPSGTIRVADNHSDIGVQFGALNTWMQFTLSVDTVTGTKLYRDGGLIYSVAGALDTTSGGSPTRLARQVGNFNEYLNGAIDDLQIYTGSLSATEAQALFSAGRSVGAAVPEPTTMALVVAALAVGGASRRRKQQV